MTASNNYRSSFQAESLLDVDSLHLSSNGVLYDFDFILEEGEDNERLFADSKSSSDLDVLLSNSKGSAAMDFQFESLENSLNTTRVDAAQENEQTRSRCGSCRSARRSQLRDRSPSPQAQSRLQRFQMNVVNFDPPSPQQQQQQQQQHFDQHQRQRSNSNVSKCSYATAQSSSVAPPISGSQYNEALQKLAESMKRTEESRKHVMMQRDMLTPAQQQALSSAKEQLNQRQQQVRRQVAVPQAASAQGYPTTTRPLSPGRSSIMDAFFSGSRGTLTNGLEHSRKQLSVYMGSVNNQTL